MSCRIRCRPPKSPRNRYAFVLVDVVRLAMPRAVRTCVRFPPLADLSASMFWLQIVLMKLPRQTSERGLLGPPTTTYFRSRAVPLSGLLRVDLLLTILSQRVSRVLARNRVQRCRLNGLSASMDAKSTGDQVMKCKLTLAAAALAISTTVFGSTAHAGATISDKRYWPNEASFSRRSEIMRVEQSVRRPGAISREGKEQRERVKAPKIRRNPS